MARQSPAVVLRPPHMIRPAVGDSNPMARRISEDFPDPLGPISTVGAPGASTNEADSRMVTPPFRTETSSIVIGSSLGGARMISSGMEFAEASRDGGCYVNRDDQGDQHDTEADGER